MNWQLDISLHWPHDRCALGWEFIGRSEKEPMDTFTLYLFICTLSFHIFDRT
jgi:hypothetical protein